jgi:hypothetical protein
MSKESNDEEDDDIVAFFGGDKKFEAFFKHFLYDKIDVKRNLKRIARRKLQPQINDSVNYSELDNPTKQSRSTVGRQKRKGLKGK